MSEISAVDVKKLRDRTGMPFGKCKEALVATNGDLEQAVEHLRKTNKEAQDKFGTRETAEGRIGAFIDPDKKLGALIEMRCESAPVAKSELFTQLANDLARQVAEKNPATVQELLAQPFVGDSKKTVTERIGDVVGQIRENMTPARFVRMTGLLGYYVHHDGTVGVMVQVEGDKHDPQILRDVSMHITARNPVAAVREHVPADRIAKEKEIAQSQIAADPKNANKPANIIAMIAEGKMKTWFADNVLVDQPFVKDESKTIGDLLKSAGLKMVKFARLRVGELS